MRPPVIMPLPAMMMPPRFNLVDDHRLLGRPGHMHALKFYEFFVGAEQFRTVEMPVVGVQFRRIDTHRAVDEDVPVVDVPLGIVLGHQVQQVLGAAHRERRDQDIAL